MAKVPVPKIATIDATGWKNRLKEAIPTRPDGTPIVIWDQFPGFVQSIRTLRDHVNAQAIELNDHKADLDNHNERLNRQNERIAALEAQPSTSPFPE